MPDSETLEGEMESPKNEGERLPVEGTSDLSAGLGADKVPLPWQRQIALAIFSKPPASGKTWLVEWLMELDKMDSLVLAKAIVKEYPPL